MLARSLLTFSRTLVLSFLSSQATGKLHVYLDTQQGGKVATVSARDGLLKGSPTPDSVTYSIVPLDANPIDASRFVVNKTETIGIVAGKTLGDADTLAVRVLYLGKRDVANREVPSVDLDPALFGSFPGLDILDLQFHPDSEQHVVVLTSDRTLRVYDVEESRCGLPAARGTPPLQGGERHGPRRRYQAAAAVRPRAPRSAPRRSLRLQVRPVLAARLPGSPRRAVHPAHSATRRRGASSAAKSRTRGRRRTARSPTCARRSCVRRR